MLAGTMCGFSRREIAGKASSEQPFERAGDFALSLPGGYPWLRPVPVKSTPLVTQYLSVKQKVPDAILFFRLGDFYEMFFEDAEIGSRVLDIQLTSRSKDGVPLCGVPYHSAEPYIAKLLKAGYKVAICEQTAPDGEAQRKTGRGGTPARGLMPRQIVRVITPGTVGEETVLTADEKSFLAAVTFGGGAFALAALDVSTGEFIATRTGAAASLREEIARIGPREIIAPRDAPELKRALLGIECPLTELDSSAFAPDRAAEVLARRFGADVAADLDGGVQAAAGAAVLYVEDNFGRDLAHLCRPRIYRATEYMLVDEVSRRHLELVLSSDGARKGSLLSVLDETLTAVGARTLANWTLYPLLDLEAIGARHDAVEELFEMDLGGAIAGAMRKIGDLERLAGRVGSMRASPRDCLRLGEALSAAEKLREAMGGRRGALLRELVERVKPEPKLAAKVVATIAEDPPVNPREGNVIRSGFSHEVDELRALASDARGVIVQLEASERERSRIPSLKVRYNQVFGYYIEVTKAHLDRVPADYERKQTLVGAERFTTPGLKELERKILSAESGLKELEFRMFARLLRDLTAHSSTILETARAVGEIDALMSMARAARRRDYVRPEMNAGFRLRIHEGRHPVLEAGMRSGEFVPNDLDADPDERQLLLITGPNMAGKSTYLRQVALIAIMAQMGSFVPATEASLGLTDRVLTRIGARDELRRGESTFMVEMRETARLLGGLTERSLLLLDEVGRGTSTFDGLAIAWAVAEHLHDATRAKVLFATHFHELTDLARERPRVKNLSMAVREWGGEVLFLRRVVEGAASQSYGIEVARLAGLPPGIVARARQILSNLETGELDESGMARLARDPRNPSFPGQMNLFAPAQSQVLDELATLDIDRLTPVEALNTLARMADRMRRGGK
jgi:DNA mismatch repair protein MutS